jgi:hypothetical protein
VNPSNLYMLEPLPYSDKTVVKYAAAMKEMEGWGDFPPAKVYKKDGNVYVVDGNHSVKAARNNGYSWVPVEYLSESQLSSYGYTHDTVVTKPYC